MRINDETDDVLDFDADEIRAVEFIKAVEAFCSHVSSLAAYIHAGRWPDDKWGCIAQQLAFELATSLASWRSAIGRRVYLRQVFVGITSERLALLRAAIRFGYSAGVRGARQSEMDRLTAAMKRYGRFVANELQDGSLTTILITAANTHEYN